MRQSKSATMPRPATISLSPKVHYNLANVTRCVCPRCGVQANSSCAREKAANLPAALKNGRPSPEDVPGAYCATGMASCPGLDLSRTCICGSCQVFKDYRLGAGEPAGYYCQNGFAR